MLESLANIFCVYVYSIVESMYLDLLLDGSDIFDGSSNKRHYWLMVYKRRSVVKGYHL